MSNLEKASRLLQDFASDNGIDVDMYHAARDLLVADLLMPDVQIIRTVEELEDLVILDARSIVVSTPIGFAYLVESAFKLYEMYKIGYVSIFPAVVVATGDQVRAAREAMEEEHG